MRSRTPASVRALASKQYSEYLQVFVFLSGSWVALHDYDGRDWVVAARWSDDIEASTASATISLAAQISRYRSLSPLATDSIYGTVLSLKQPIEIKYALMPRGDVPAAGDYLSVFSGRIEQITTGEAGIELSCRDLGGALLDDYIQAQHVYGTAVGSPVETEMQAILTDAATGVTLYTPTSPSWNVTEWIQDKTPVLSALQVLADQIGWQVRYRYHEATSAWRLTFFEPPRTKTTADHVFTDTQLTVSQPTLDGSQIRNTIQVVYSDSTTGERAKEVATDATSIAAYGEQWMEVEEDASSNIDSSTEAATFAAKILADLKDPLLSQSVKPSIPWPWVELHDLYQLGPDAHTYGTAQKIAVRSYSQTYQRGALTTTMQLAGKPSSPPSKWLGRDAGRNAAPSDFLGTLKKGHVTRYTARYGLQPFNQATTTRRNSMLPNGDFGAQSRVIQGSGWPPDGWSMVAGSWAADGDAFISDTITKSGGRSLWLLDSSTTPVELVSDPIPVEAGELYSGYAWIYGDSSDSGDELQLLAQFYEPDKVTTIGSPIEISAHQPAGAAWISQLGYALAPAGAGWVRISIKKTTSTEHNCYIDSIVFEPAILFATAQSDFSSSTTRNVLKPSAAEDDPAGIYNSSNGFFDIRSPGVYQIKFKITFYPGYSSGSEEVYLMLKQAGDGVSSGSLLDSWFHQYAGERQSFSGSYIIRWPGTGYYLAFESSAAAVVVFNLRLEISQLERF